MTSQPGATSIPTAVLRRLLRNLKWIFSSQIAVALLGLVFLPVAARALGAAGLGVMAIGEAYARIVSRFLHLEPWQAVIRYGSTALEEEDRERFRRLVGLSVLIDVVGGVLAAGAAIAFAPIIAGWLGLDQDLAWVLPVASLGILVSLRPTGLALLRSFDRFDLLAKLDIFAASVRMVLGVIAWQLGFGLPGFVAIFVAVSLLDGVLAFAAGLREMSRNGYGRPMLGIKQTLGENSGFLRFVWNSNLSVILRQTTQRLDVIILGVLISPTMVGYYHIAKRCGEAALRLGRPLSQAIYPEFTRFAARNEFDRLQKMLTGLSAGFWGVIALVLIPVILMLEPIVTAIFGVDYAPAVPVVRVQAIAVGIYLGGILLNPALLSLGQDRALVRIGLLNTILFLILIAPMVSVLGVVGAAVAHMLCNSVWLGLCVLHLRRTLLNPALHGKEQVRP